MKHPDKRVQECKMALSDIYNAYSVRTILDALTDMAKARANANGLMDKHHFGLVPDIEGERAALRRKFDAYD
jgi:hypothetical protein